MRRRVFVRGLATTGAGLALPAALPAGLAGTAAAAPRPASAAASWREVPAPGGQPASRLYGVAAARPDLAWAVGTQGLDSTSDGTAIALSWDGTAWSATDLSHLTYATLRSVAVSPSGGAAWAVGTDIAGHDQLLTWDGTTWREASFPGRGEAGTQVTDVAAGPDGRFWVSGRHGGRAGLLRGDGKTWRWCRPLPDEAAPTPSGVHVTPGGEVWVFGDVIARWDGAWTVIPRLLGIRASVSGLLPVAHDDIWLTGWGYGIGGPADKPPSVRLEHWDGTKWNGVKGPFGVGMLTSIVGDAHGRPDRISGWDFWDQKRAHYLRWDGTGWVSERGPETPSVALPVALARIPGTDGGLWSVGTTSFYPYPPARNRVERLG
ncbi:MULTISPECIES: hypothetical protein [Streptomyces]|uniref:hypothetical protein n=1 Tax=Streptomyces TaxID=1883 RepID=UPI001E31A5BC|nr:MULTISPECIES: hypothetical protein [Streptomyces]UFQ14180.1 hypothetical protein J2N69_03615 [Streptomyces huasconensis]WCL83778.1 hypothetical protein PPN52_03600 [Streptomyces sp. JCM 35825]